MAEQATIPRLHRPDLAEFRRRFERPRRPVVITGAMENWKAMERWSPDYLAEHLGDQQVPVITPENPPAEGQAIRPDDLPRIRPVKVTLREFVAELGSGTAPRGYMSGISLRKHMPALLDDIETPEYREEGSSASPRMWLGRLVGPLHYDLSNNLHGIVYGAKRFVFFSPDQLSRLYPFSPFSIVPTMSRVMLSEPDYDRFPRLREAESIVVDLGPGELLFVPAGWWHQVTTPSTTISIDFPWQSNGRMGRPFWRLIPWHVLRYVRGRLSR